MWGVVMERLTERERYTIELMRKEGYTVIKIAEYLNRNPNVIFFKLLLTFTPVNVNIYLEIRKSLISIIKKGGNLIWKKKLKIHQRKNY